MSRVFVFVAVAGIAAAQVQAVTLFGEDFEGHSVGQTLSGVNGWSAFALSGETLGELRVSNDGVVLDGNFADGTNTSGTTSGSMYVNEAGISGGLDTNLSYVLSWTWANLGDTTHNTEFGFAIPPNTFGVRLTLEGAFNANSGQSRLLSPTGSDGAGWPGDVNTNDFRIYIDSSTILGFRDGIQVAGAPMDPVTMSSITGIYWFIDTGGVRNPGQIDNIHLSDSTPVTADPVNISTVVVENVVGFEFASQGGVDYFLECSTNMVDWTRLYTIHGQGIQDEAVFDPGGFDSNKSYRVITPVP